MIEGTVRTSFQPSAPSLFIPIGRRNENARQPERGTASASNSQSGSNETRGSGPAAVLELTPEEEQIVARLRTADLQVRQHERAHLAAAGGHATSGARFQYVIGPDGRRYAVGGEVSISVTPEATPEATIQKARAIRRAALAPADPSAQDRAVAAQASRLEAQAQREINQERAEEATGRQDSEAEPIEPTEDSSVGVIIDLIA